jgi:hypothetical protein
VIPVKGRAFHGLQGQSRVNVFLVLLFGQFQQVVSLKSVHGILRWSIKEKQTPASKNQFSLRRSNKIIEHFLILSSIILTLST